MDEGRTLLQKVALAYGVVFGGGAVYLVLWLIGMFSAMDWLPADVTDHWLHFVLGLSMVVLGVLLGRRAEPALARA